MGPTTRPSVRGRRSGEDVITFDDSRPEGRLADSGARVLARTETFTKSVIRAAKNCVRLRFFLYARI